MRVTRILGLAFVAASVAGPALADFQVREVRTDVKGKPLGERTLIVSGSRLRLDEGEAGFIVDVAKGKVLWLDHKAKTWIETPLAGPAMDTTDLVRRSQAEAVIAKLEETGPKRYVSTKETKQIAGASATRTDVFIGTRRVRELWHAESLPMDDVMAIQIKLAELDGAIMRERSFLELQNTAHLGYPALVVDFEGGLTVEVKEIKRGPVPAAQFGVPAGYRKAE